MSEGAGLQVMEERRRPEYLRLTGREVPGPGPSIGQVIDSEAVLEPLRLRGTRQVERIDVAEADVAEALELGRESERARARVQRDGAVERIKEFLASQINASSATRVPITAACINPRAWPLASPTA